LPDRSIRLDSRLRQGKNKRLFYGSLVCLWNASQRPVILADPSPRATRRSWIIVHPPEQDLACFSYTMLVYQQQLPDGLFPFKECLLGMKRDPGVPGHLNTKTSRQGYLVITTTDGRIVNVADSTLNLTTWPSVVDIGWPISSVDRVWNNRKSSFGAVRGQAQAIAAHRRKHYTALELHIVKSGLQSQSLKTSFETRYHSRRRTRRVRGNSKNRPLVPTTAQAAPRAGQ
jgi:hypothetical protein